MTVHGQGTTGDTCDCDNGGMKNYYYLWLDVLKTHDTEGRLWQELVQTRDREEDHPVNNIILF